MICCAFHSNASCVAWLRFVQFVSLFDGLDCDDSIFTCILLCLLHWLPFILARETCLNEYHLKCDALGTCLNWHEEYVRNACALLLKIRKVGPRFTMSKRNWKKDMQWASGWSTFWHTLMDTSSQQNWSISGRRARFICRSCLWVTLPHILSDILAFFNSSWVDDKTHKRSCMFYCLLFNNAAFSRRAALSQIIALSTVEAELVALSSCSCEIVWARKLARVRIPAAQAHGCIWRQHWLHRFGKHDALLG